MLQTDTGSYLLPLNWKWDKYHSDVEVASLLVSLQTKCPTGLAAPYTLGLSEEGRAMIALEVETSHLHGHLDNAVPRALFPSYVSVQT